MKINRKVTIPYKCVINIRPLYVQDATVTCVEYTIYTLYIIQLTVYQYHNRQHIRNTTDSINAKQVAVYTLYMIQLVVSTV